VNALRLAATLLGESFCRPSIFGVPLLRPAISILPYLGNGYDLDRSCRVALMALRCEPARTADAISGFVRFSPPTARAVSSPYRAESRLAWLFGWPRQRSRDVAVSFWR
jgi:hypothetical protein